MAADDVGPLRNRYYTHGGFMALAPRLAADAEWRARLERLQPALAARLSRARSPAAQMKLLENCPVLAAYGVSLEPGGEWVAIEWDAWLHPTDPKSAAKMAISHGSVWDYVRSGILGGTVFPAHEPSPAEWLATFGHACAEAAGAPEPESEPWERAFARLCPGRPFAVVLDVKSGAHAMLVSGLVQQLNAMGVLVEAVGSFARGTVAGVGAGGRQVVSGKSHPPPRELWFQHTLGDVQRVCELGEARRGDVLAFNVGGVLAERDDEAVMAALRRYQRDLGVKFAAYSQEYALSVRSARRLRALVDRYADVFELGYAWGGGEASLPSGMAGEEPGVGLQWWAGDVWSPSVALMGGAGPKED